jgi:hypothetical protein
MEYEIACDRLCDDISQLLLSGPSKPSLRTTYAAGRATQDLAAAFHRAAGQPQDELWSHAIESLDHFLDLCNDSKLQSSRALHELRSFVDENGDLLAPRPRLKLAS